jgi:Repeat of unknown function (DUF346)
MSVFLRLVKGRRMRWNRDSRGRWQKVVALSAGAVLALFFPGAGLLPAGGGMVPASAAATVAPAALTGPAVGSWGGGRLDLFYRDGHNGQLAHQWYVPAPLATWTAAESLGGTLTSQPAVASWAAGRYDVFARGVGGGVWHKWYSGGWSGWQSLGGVASSPPAAAAWGPGRLDVFIRGSDNRLWTKRYAAGAGWSGWTSLGGTLTSGPAVVSWGPGRLDVFARGANNVLWHKWYSGRWSGWQSLGGTLAGEPAAASLGPGKLDVFGRGTNNAIWTRSFNVGGTGWSPWASLGGTITSSPSATVPDAGVTAVFARGADGRYYYRQRSAALVWSPGRQVADAALTFRGLGAWVDTFDYSALDPATVVTDLQAHGVRTLYLGTARFDSATDILYPVDVAAWLAAAHAAGIRVVGWYVPNYADLTRDVRRTLAIASYVSPAGQRFDAIGIDIEYPLDVSSPSAWNQAVATHLARVRAGTTRPVAAIVLPPVLMRGWPDPNRWAAFPWSAVSADANAVAPMSYWTSYTPATRCAAGDPQYCAYQYTRDNVLLSRQLTGLPVHVIGGVGDQATLAQVSNYVRAARETAAAGGSLFDYRTTQPQFWPYLEQLTP